MTTSTTLPGRQARDLMAAGDWMEAFDLLRAADADTPLSGDGLMTLAEAAYGAGHYEAATEAFERAHGAHLAAGNLPGAAGAAVHLAMYLMMDTGLMAPVRGWLRRAARLLDGLDESSLHAAWAMTAAYERFLSGDMDAARDHGHDAIVVGDRQDAPGPATMGQIVTARIQILDGQVAAGLELLDEAAVTVMAGELDALAAGMAWCELICAMQGLAQYDRAEQWTEAMDRWRHGNAFGGIHGRCRVHRAEILRLRGSCAEAEEEALHACQELRPWMRREFGWPLTELGTIRLRRGDLAGAEEAFVAAHEHGWDPQPGLALLYLAKGDTARAMGSIQQALDHPLAVPSKERPPCTALCRAPLLEAQAHIAVAANDLDTAERAVEELDQIAERYASQAIRAGAVTARGRLALARGDIDVALDQIAEGVRAWVLVGAPYETAVARRWLAAAHRAAGHEDRALLEFRAATTTLERIGASPQATVATEDAQGAADLLAGRSLVAPPGTTTSGVFRRDGDTWTLAFGPRQVLLQDLKGLRYIARLLAEPGREFHVLDLAAVEAETRPAPRTTDDHADRANDHAGPVLDRQAREAYRRRLAEIDEDLEEAEHNADLERVARAKADRDFLVQELSRAVGLGGRSRVAHATAERARSAVTRSIRYALARIAEHHTDLAGHLEHAVRTGTYCAYDPDPVTVVTWST
jgi:tetratricopeptide (TPR) repeat protein